MSLINGAVCTVGSAHSFPPIQSSPTPSPSLLVTDRSTKDEAGALVGNELRQAAGAAAWVATHGAVEIAAGPIEKASSVAVTSYEGSKGRSAQYVFLIGLHWREIPINHSQNDDIEICRFLVGLRRTKKKCDVLFAKNAMGKWKNRSEFLDWIRQERFQNLQVNAAYFT